MKYRNNMVILMIILVVLSPFLSVFSSAADEVTIKIHMIGEQPRTSLNNPIIVAGIWHYINVTLENQGLQEITLKFYEGESVPTIDERDATNYYEWNYNENNQQWTDVNIYGGYYYINNESCQKQDNTYSFCVGVKDTFASIPFYHENWTLAVYGDGEGLYSDRVVVEKPTSSLAKTHGDIIQVNVSPFTLMDASGSDYFTIENKGNIPLDIVIDYGQYNDFIDVDDFGTKLSALGSSNYHINLRSESWKPEIRDITGEVTGTLSGSYIITSGPLTFSPTLKINAPDLILFVGHSNYEIFEFTTKDITFQYEENLEMSADEIKDISVYISGDGIVTLDIWSDEKNITILKIFDENQEENPPLSITSTDTSEYNIGVRVKALKENKVGYIYYELETDEETQTFITQINVGPPESTGEQTEFDFTSITTIIVILCIILVIGYMILSYIRYRR